MAAKKPATPKTDPSPPTKLYFSDTLGNEIVKISVGNLKNLEVFQVHKKILCDKAAYFDKMFNGNFKDGIEQSATFPEDEPCTWKYFIGWLYKGIIESPTGGPPGPELVTDRIKLFCLAEKYGIPDLLDASMDSLIAAFRSRNTVPSQSSILSSYSMTRSGSKLRLYMGRSFVYDTLRNGEDFHDWTNKKYSRCSRTMTISC